MAPALRRLCSLLLVLILAGPALAAPPVISIGAKVDKSDITVGDLIRYTLSVRHEPEVKVNIPLIGEKLGEFIIRNTSTPRARRENGMVVDEVTYEITIYLTGEFSVPGVEIAYTYTDDEGKEVSETISTEALDIKVHRVAPENATDIRDIKGPVDVPVSWRYYAFWGAIALVVIAAIAAGILFWTRRRSRAEERELLAPPKPAHEVALERFKTIEEMDLVAQGRFKEYYDLVTGVLREYLGARYTIDALEMTSSELLGGLSGSLRDMELRSKVASVLEEGDMVKFAKFEPDKDRATAALAEAKTVVERTVPWIFKREHV